MRANVVPWLVAAGVAWGAVASTSCSFPEQGRDKLALPDRPSFDSVAIFLNHRCGSLDCHGSIARNLKIYGNKGLRLDATHRPGDGNPTTTLEIEATYGAVVGLEPELLSAVVGDDGADPERLTFLRKPLSRENHKGGLIIEPGDVQDRCLRSWLRGKADAEDCGKTLLLP